MADGERPLIVTRRHPIVLARSMAIVFLSLVGLYLLSATVQPGNGVLGVLALAWLGVLGWGFLEWFLYWGDWIVVTQKRVMRIDGIIPGVAMLPIARVTDFGYHRSVLGALLGYGTFELESAGQIQALRDLTYVPKPNHVYDVIVAALYSTE
jgi:hypothetical protein